VHAHARVNFESFLKEFELTLDEISYFILHPGGAKVLDAYNKALNLSNGKLDICRRALRDFGNVSAVSVLLVLEEHIRQYSYSDGEYGLISALGPGFCSENLLVMF
jgi:alkylresorcinol/alkylpyrone synthase